jgi:cell wall-associated NlpC family hydrolase
MRSFTASEAIMPSPRRTFVRTVLLAAAGLVLAAGIAVPSSSVAAPSLASKQAQAAELDRQVAKLEDQYGDLQERWRGALVELRETQADMRDARAKLKIAKRDLQGAKVRLEDRAIAIYQDGGGSNELQQVAEAGSIQDFFARLDTIDRVSTQDSNILVRVRDAAERVEKQERRLHDASVKQAKVVKRADKSKKKMRKVLDKKQAALNSVTADIVAIMEQQRAAAAAADAVRARASAAEHAEITGGGGNGTNGGGSTNVDAGGSSDSAPSESEASDSGSVSVPLPPASGTAAAAASIAVGKSGSPYEFGAAGPNTFDCSGLVVWAFAQAGRGGLPHSTYSLIGMGVEVPIAEAQVGDLVFTNNSGHMGIYVGGGSFVHAPRTGRTVTVEGLGNYSIVSIRRI